MAVRCSVIWLLTGVVFVVQLPVTRGQLCPPRWAFHALTGSCMALVRKNFLYSQAKYYCQDNFRSRTTKSEGHLVFIFDQATDEFVKGLLGKDNLDRAFIGLHDRARNGEYAWGDHNMIPANYTGWANNSHTPVGLKQVVVMTNDGWQEYDAGSKAYFVCQVSADFPTPKMTCPVAEVGQESPDIRCTTDTHQQLSITGVRFMKTAEVVALCDANTCWSGQGFGQVVDVGKPPETGSSAPWTLKLRNVRISDAANWTCSVEFNNRSYWITSRPCSLNVYMKPADIQCSHRFVQAKVTITCTAAQVYPRVGCSWKVNLGSQQLTVYKTLSNVVDNDDGYYKATCNASLNIYIAGIYDVTVTMALALPNLQFHEVKKTIVSVAPPQQPPQLYLAGQILQPLWVEVVENQTLSLTCWVPGGDPQVYRTIITCYNIPQQSEGNSITVGVRVTREFHGRSCTCNALHTARYTQTSSVEIRVIYPATVTSFWIASRSSSTSIISGEEITFTCDAYGSPMSQLILQRQNGPTLTNSSTGDITYQKNATCNDTGSYVCLASNTVQGQHHQDSQVAHIQVTCAPEHCSETSSPRFPAAVGAPSASFKICVRAYPAPTSFILYKGSTTNRLRADKFQVYFNFTNEQAGLGEITIMIYRFTAADIGEYKLYSEYKPHSDVELYSFLTFSVFAQATTTPDTTTASITIEANTTAENVTTSTGTTQGVRQDFECHLNYMYVFIPVDLVPNSQLTLRDPNCRLINNGTHHKISFDYNECGTSQSFYTEYISVENDVNVHNIFNDTAEITFVEDYKIPLRCSVDRSKIVNGVIEVMPRESIQESIVQSPDFYMKEFTTKDYNQEITEYPVKLPINREIFFEIAVRNRNSSSTGIFVEKCEATPSSNPNDTVHVSLIHFGCSVIPAVKVLPAPGIDRFRFSIQAFHFSAPANSSNLVYVHCSASTCGGVLCDNSCLHSSRRRKRSARGLASATLTSGSHVVS